MDKKTAIETLGKLTETVSALEQRVETLATTPVHDARSLLYGGGAPGIRRGEDSMSSRGWQLQRAIGLQIGAMEPDDCKVERDIHDKLYRQFVEHGGMQRASARSLLIPVSSEAIAADDAELAAECRQSVLQGAGQYDPEHTAWLQRQQALPESVRQTLSTHDDTAGGSLVAPASQGELIELVRNASVLGRLGVRNITLPTSGKLNLPRQTGSVTSAWIGESTAITPSDVATGHLALTAKKIGSLLKSPNELFRFTLPGSVERLLRQDMAMSAATKIDQTAIDGTSSSVAPKGIINYSGITTLTASVTGADGDDFSPSDPARMLASLESNNHQLDDSVAFVLRGANFYELLEERGDSINSGDGLGPFLFAMNREAIQDGKPPRLRGHRVVTSESVPRDRAKGSATNLSLVLCGKWSDFVVASLGVAEVAATDSGDTAFTTDQTWIRLIQHLDFGPRHEDAFVLMDDLLSTFAD